MKNQGKRFLCFAFLFVLCLGLGKRPVKAAVAPDTIMNPFTVVSSGDEISDNSKMYWFKQPGCLICQGGDIMMISALEMQTYTSADYGKGKRMVSFPDGFYKITLESGKKAQYFDEETYAVNNKFFCKEIEDNNTPETATDIKFKSRENKVYILQGHVGEYDLRDYFKFTVNSPSVMRFEVQENTTLSDKVLIEVFEEGAMGELLPYRRVWRTLPPSEKGQWKGIDYALWEEGTYYLKISVSEGKEAYHIALYGTDNTDRFEEEPNDEKDSATEMKQGLYLNGYVCDQQWDVDYYKFRVPDYGALSVTHVHRDEYWTSSVSDGYTAELYNERGKRLYRVTFGEKNRWDVETVKTVMVKPGWYYVKIKGNKGFPETYGIMAKFEKGGRELNRLNEIYFAGGDMIRPEIKPKKTRYNVILKKKTNKVKITPMPNLDGTQLWINGVKRKTITVKMKRNSKKTIPILLRYGKKNNRQYIINVMRK